MSNSENHRRTRAGRLMYEYRIAKKTADAITLASPITNTEQLVRAVGAFRDAGFTNDQVATWMRAGVDNTFEAADWIAIDYTPQGLAILRARCERDPKIDTEDYLLTVLEAGVRPDFAELCLKAGIRSTADLADYNYQDQSGEDIRPRLVLLAALAAD